MSAINEMTILGRLFDENTSFSPEAARWILAIEFSRADVDRMNSLAAKARAGTLTPEEREETGSYERAGLILSILKSRARMALKGATASGGSR